MNSPLRKRLSLLLAVLAFACRAPGGAGASSGADHRFYPAGGATGDLSGDGLVNIIDPLLCLRIIIGLPIDTAAGSWAPSEDYPGWLREATGVAGEESVNLEHLLRILRQAAGLVDEPPGEPRRVTAVLDEQSTAQATITPLGGELTVTDSAGNSLSITIPEGALVDERLISITVIAAIEDLPMGGGLVAGIDLQPDGLLLHRPAILELVPADPDLVATMLAPETGYKLTGFGYLGDGDDFHLYPYTIEENTVRFRINRFSGYGAGGASDQDRRDQRNHPPEDERARFEQEMADLLNEEAERQANDPDAEPCPETREAISELMRLLYENVIRANLEEALDDDQVLACAARDYLSWAANARLLGLDELVDDTVGPDAEALLRVGLLNAFEKTHQRAVADVDASQIRRYLWLKAQAALTGVLDESDRAMVRERLEKISRFDFRFESTAWDTEDGYNWVISVASERITLTGDEGFVFLSGTGPLEHTGASWDCLINFQGVGSTLAVSQAVIGLPAYHGPPCEPVLGQPPPAPEVDVFFNPGQPLETFTFQCEGDEEPITVGPMPMWAGAFTMLHIDMLDFGTGDFYLGDWEMILGEPYARKQVNSSSEGVSGTTVLTLWYAPEH